MQLSIHSAALYFLKNWNSTRCHGDRLYARNASVWWVCISLHSEMTTLTTTIWFLLKTLFSLWPSIVRWLPCPTPTVDSEQHSGSSFWQTQQCCLRKENNRRIPVNFYDPKMRAIIRKPPSPPRSSQKPRMAKRFISPSVFSADISSWTFPW